MLNSRSQDLSKLGSKSPGYTPIFSPKSKGSILNTTPSVNPALKSLAFNHRKKLKLG